MPSFVEEEDNMNILEEVFEEELKEVLNSFQKDKSLGPDVLSVEFFMVLIDIVGNDILHVIEEYRREG